MEFDDKQGRTPWDLITAVLKSKSLIKLSLLVLTIVVLFTSLLFLGIYIVAKPGSNVEFLWGLVKYQKDNPKVELHIVAEKPQTSNYILPKNIPTYGYVTATSIGPRLIPFLDKTVNVTINESSQAIIFRGANINELSIGARDGDGNRLNIYKTIDGEGIWVDFNTRNAAIELNYKGNFFILEVERTDESPGALSAQQIPSPSMKLVSFSKLL